MTPGAPIGDTGACAERGASGGADGPARELGHVPALDGLRGIAVLLVLLNHTAFLVDPIHDRAFNVAVLDDFARGGFVGVDIFFVLSGFLITALALREYGSSRRISLPAFYRRRALRLLPALVVLLAVHALYTAVEHLNMAQERTTDVAALFYFLNYRMTHGPGIAPAFGHLWSLSVEEQFYFVWPLALIAVLASKRLRQWFVPLAIATIALVTIRRVTLYSHAHDWTKVVWRTDTRFDALVIGALAAWLWRRRRTPWPYAEPVGWVALVVLVCAIEVSRADGSFPYVAGYTIYAVSTACIIFAVLDSKWFVNRFLSTRSLRVIGRTSYGIYLWHLPIFFAVDHSGSSMTSLERVLCAYGVTALATVASYTLVERPALRWKDRLEARGMAREIAPAG